MVGLVGFLCVAGSAGLLIFGLRQFRKFRIVSGKNPMRIGSVRGGFFEFRGKVKPMLLTRSPHSGVECVYYQILEEEWAEPIGIEVGVRRKTGEWRTTREEAHGVEFLLEDASGVARILPDKAEWHLKIDVGTARSILSPPELQIGIVRTMGNVAVGGALQIGGERWADGQRRVTESYVVPGDSLHVIGQARPTVPHAGAPPSRITISGEGAPIFLITDKPMGDVVKHLQLQAFASWAGAIVLLLLPVLGYLAVHAKPAFVP